MSIETAVIPVAGAGSRMFPETTAIEKSMMPVYAGDTCRPLVDYMVEDCAAAGLKRVIFVTTERGQVQLNDYFGANLNQTTERQLRRVGKGDKINDEMARRLDLGMTFDYIIQNPDEYGTAVPLASAESALRGEKQFALLGGDDFVYRQDGKSVLGEALETWEKSGAQHGIMGLPIDRSESGKYGILQTGDRDLLSAIDEKPPEERWPEHPVANISRYLLSAEIWPFVHTEMTTDRGTGEHYVTYPINAALEAGQTFYVHGVEGKYMDGGSVQGIRDAGNYITEHPRLSE